MIATTINAAENTRAGTKDPVACTRKPVIIGPTTPLRADPVFCIPANTAAMLRGAISPGSAHVWEAATVVPDLAIHSNTIVTTTDSVKAAIPMQDAISKPMHTNNFRVAVNDNNLAAYTLSDIQPAPTSANIANIRGSIATNPMVRMSMPLS